MNKAFFGVGVWAYGSVGEREKGGDWNLPFSIILIAFCWIGATTEAGAQSTLPTLTGRIVDQAEILSPSTEETLTVLLAAHEEATTNQVGVLTVASLGGEPIEGFSIRVAEAWALGTAEHDNGVLLVVATEDRKLRIEVGYGLEGVLPDVIAGRIISEQIVPYFREGNYERGIEVGVLAVLGRLESEAELVETPGPGDTVPDPAVETPAPAAFSIDWWQVMAFLYFLASLVLCSVAAALAVLEKTPQKELFFIAFLIGFFFIGRSLGYFVFWFVPPYLLAVVIAGCYAVFFWRVVVRLNRDPAIKAAWQRRLLIYGPDPDTSSGKDDASKKEEAEVAEGSPFPRKLQGVVLIAFSVQVGLFLYTRWLSVIWLIVGVLLTLFCLGRIAEDPARRKRRRSTTWTPFGAIPSGASRSSGSSRSRRRSYTSSSWSSRSSSSWSSRSSSSSSSYSSSSGSSSSSYSGGGGSFGGGGASGSW